MPRVGTSCSFFLLSITTVVTTFGSGGLTSLITIVFLIVLFLLGLVDLPFLLLLDGKFERPVMVPLTIVANEGVPPELVDTEGNTDGASIVDLVVVANPAADESPCGLPGGISTDAPDLGGLAA